ncbi:MAG: tal 1 [candidate division NC10 bacterium]|nr:tal 1 [candidate division NC10 bacterium]
MNTTATLADFEQGVWLEGLTRDMLASGALSQYVHDRVVTGLITDTVCFRKAIRASTLYDAAIREAFGRGVSVEDVFVGLALEDVSRAADLFRPMYDRTKGSNGWVSLDLSPLFARDADQMLAVAKDLHARLGRPNIFIGIPGTQEGLSAAEEAILAGVPVNVGLLFSPEHYVAAADAFLRGIERRIAAGLSPNVAGVASVVVHRWGRVRTRNHSRPLIEQLGLAIAKRTYKVHCTLLNSSRWQRARVSGFQPQRLVWISGTEKRSETFVLALDTVNVITERRLRAIADDGVTGNPLPADGGDCDEVLARSARAGMDVHGLAARFQAERIRQLAKCWRDMLALITSRGVVCTDRR